MYPALENKNIPAVKTALDKTSLVAVHRGLRKMGEPRIGKHLMDHKVGQAIGEACARNHTGNRLHRHAFLNKSCTFLDFINKR
jgi:hypothetical protein